MMITGGPMENQAKPINPALIPLLVIGGILLVLVVAIVIAKSRNSDPTSDSATQPAATEAPAPTFGMEQNDQEGYNKIPWGTSYREFVKQTRAASTVPSDSGGASVSNAPTSTETTSAETASTGDASTGTAPTETAPVEPAPRSSFIDSIEPQDTNTLVAKILGVPTEQRAIGPLRYSELKWGVIPKKFYSDKKDDVEYVFYDGKLAMAFTELKASSYDAIRADLSSRYAQIDTLSDSWDRQQLEEQPDREELQAILFKRGASNTRVYLIQSIFHATGLGYKETSVYLLYVPNSSYQAIRSEIAQNDAAALSAAQAKQRQSEQPDFQKAQ
jgi:hypothetical protein